ncbi:MAG: hypothetical protein R3236_06385 [Phycisphaeraceae bacterium]|nr:hypothetical protein [Phycisphaeraceae bacterium]
MKPTRLLLLMVLLLPAGASRAADPPVLGQGDWRFRLRTDAIGLPAEHHTDVQDYHGVAVDSKGRVYIGYYSSKVRDHTRTVARFTYHPKANPPFRFDRFLGTKEWVAGRIHGLNIVRNDAGEQRLLLVYNKHRVILCDLDGNIENKGFHVQHKHFGKASDGHRARGTEGVGVLDGYRSNKFVELSLKDGRPTGRITGGRGKGDGKTSTAHGVGIDPDGRFVVADRGNQRLTWWKKDLSPLMLGDRQKQMSMKGYQVCNVAFTGKVAVVPSLNARLAIIGPDPGSETGHKILSSLVIPPDLVRKGYDGVHDANFTPDHRFIVVAVWQRKRSVPPRLFALERIQINKP